MFPEQNVSGSIPTTKTELNNNRPRCYTSYNVTVTGIAKQIGPTTAKIRPISVRFIIEALQHCVWVGPTCWPVVSH